MSIWTHVTGAIRIDGVLALGDKYTIEILKKFLGNMCKFSSTQEEWKNCTVPRGSEGSIQYHIHEYDKGLPWVVVTVWGDLRDYGDLEGDFDKIVEWFTKICGGTYIIRQAILEVEVEGKTPCVLRWDGSKVVITYVNV